MIVVLGDLIADIGMRIAQFPIDAGDIQRLAELEVGPGGATNIAIMAARFGLDVACLGELGGDNFGELVIGGLQSEGIDTSEVLIRKGERTPVAGVLLDQAGEPAYLGHGGDLAMSRMPDEWKPLIQKADALFADGWAEHEGVPGVLLEGFELAKEANVPIFFDPGPGNPAVDNAWAREAIRLSTVLLANEDEITRLSGKSDANEAAQVFLEEGVEWVLVKRSARGCLLATSTSREIHEGALIKADLRDTTGAGDSVAGAVIFGYLLKLPEWDVVNLANATGAAKVQKFGTGLNMPTIGEVRAMLEQVEKNTNLLKHLENSKS